MNKNKLLKFCKENNFEVMSNMEGNLLIFTLPESQKALEKYLKRHRAKFKDKYTANLDYVRFVIKVGD